MLVPALIGFGCDSRQDSYRDSSGAASPAYQTERGRSAGQPSRERQAELLNRIRQADPRFQTIEKAVINENNELGLILSRNVNMDDIPSLMRSMLTEMAKEFPGQDLTVIAYAPSQPPAKLGTARFDARTRQMTYTPEQGRF